MVIGFNRSEHNEAQFIMFSSEVSPGGSYRFKSIIVGKLSIIVVLKSYRFFPSLFCVNLRATAHWCMLEEAIISRRFSSANDKRGSQSKDFLQPANGEAEGLEEDTTYGVLTMPSSFGTIFQMIITEISSFAHKIMHAVSCSQTAQPIV